MPLKAALFDLDDTIYDSRRGNRAGLMAAQQAYACFQQKSIDEFEKLHKEVIEELHLQLVSGEASLDEVRIERFVRLFSLHWETVEPKIAQEAFAVFRQGYLDGECAIPGVVP